MNEEVEENVDLVNDVAEAETAAEIESTIEEASTDALENGMTEDVTPEDNGQETHPVAPNATESRPTSEDAPVEETVVQPTGSVERHLF